MSPITPLPTHSATLVVLWLVPERGDHQLDMEKNGQSDKSGSARRPTRENRRPMVQDPLPCGASMAKLARSTLPML